MILKYMKLLGVMTLVFFIFTAENVIAETVPLKVYDDWGGDFSLLDHNGFPLRLSDFAGKVVLLNFGYTHCPDICPTTMFGLKRVVQSLAEDSSKVQVLFITLDPERDNAKRLRTYVEYFDSGFLALTGGVNEIARIAEQYGVHFEKENFDKEGNYSIAHDAVVYLIDQHGKIRVFFKANAPADTIVDGIQRLLREEN